MTGVADLARNAKVVRWVVQRALLTVVARFPAPLQRAVAEFLMTQNPDCEDEKIPVPRLLDPRPRSPPSGNVSPVRWGEKAGTAPVAPLRWGLLLPICSRGDAPEACWDRLHAFSDSLVRTTSEEDRSMMTIHVGIDDGDEVFDCDEAKARIARLFGEFAATRVCMLEHMYRSNLCWIWAELARCAVAGGGDLFVFLGDDVELGPAGLGCSVEGFGIRDEGHLPEFEQ